MKISKIKNNNKIIIWNLVIAFFLCVVTCFVLATTVILLSKGNLYSWATGFLTLLTGAAISVVVMSPVHELGHILMILFFDHKLEVKWYPCHTECDYEKLSDCALRAVAMAGSIFAILVAISIPFYFSDFKIISIAIIASNYIQLLNLLAIKLKSRPLDGYIPFHLSEFREFSRHHSTNEKCLIYHFNKPK